MNYTKEYINLLARQTNLLKDNLEKVLRLSKILQFFNNDSILCDSLALKGGTSINLTIMNLPRLSVDIDLDYIKSISKEEKDKDRSIIEKRIIDYMTLEGYKLLTNSRIHYALLSMTFSYINNSNNKDNIKIEINFMNRCHILPIEKKKTLATELIPSFEILTLNAIEIYASKINALLSRAAARDLYDVYIMIKNNVILGTTLLRKCIIFYNMVGGEQDIDNLDYKNIESIDYQKIKRQLKPVISKSDSFDYTEAKKVTINYLKSILILTDKELEFVKNFKNKLYKPELIFDDEQIIERIKNHPMALWRCK